MMIEQLIAAITAIQAMSARRCGIRLLAGRRGVLQAAFTFWWSSWIDLTTKAAFWS